MRWCILFLALVACGKSPEPFTPVTEMPRNAVDAVDLDESGPNDINLLSLARGASVVSRTAELTLENSATHAIDGDWMTFWRSSPGGPEQTMIFSLAARSRIDRIGVIAPPGPETPARLRFDASDDGTTWREIRTLDLTSQRDPQIARVAPFDARYLRVQTIGTSSWYSSIRSLIAKGTILGPANMPPIEGCWHINGMPARFSRRGTNIAGVIGNNPPMYVLGGTDPRAIVRLTWMRGAMWGPAIVTLDPQRRALSGQKWHEWVRDQTAGDGWFGTPSQCNEVVFNETKIASAMLKHAGVWTAYGDSAIDTLAALVAEAPTQRFSITVHNTAERDKVQRALGSNLARVEILDGGSAQGIITPQRVMADGVELRAR